VFTHPEEKDENENYIP